MIYDICHIMTLYIYNIIDKICHSISNNIIICKILESYIVIIM